MKTSKTKADQTKNKKLLTFWLIIIASTVVLTHDVRAQASTYTTTTANDILSQMHSFRGLWMTNIFMYANRLFWFLAFIEFAWSVIALALDKTDLQSWVLD